MADTVVRVQRELAAREVDAHARGTLLGAGEGEGVGEPGVLAVPD